jgi:hypothetical protein
MSWFFLDGTGGSPKVDGQLAATSRHEGFAPISAIESISSFPDRRARRWRASFPCAEGYISGMGFHRKKPKGKTMPERTRLANAQKSKVRSAIEHVFAHQKGLLNLTIRTIGLARAA